MDQLPFFGERPYSHEKLTRELQIETGGRPPEMITTPLTFMFVTHFNSDDIAYLRQVPNLKIIFQKQISYAYIRELFEQLPNMVEIITDNIPLRRVDVSLLVAREALADSQTQASPIKTPVERTQTRRWVLMMMVLAGICASDTRQKEPTARTDPASITL